MPKEYLSTQRTVVCYAQPLADGRFIGMVSVRLSPTRSTGMVVHKCSGSDFTADDAVVLG